ncbi:hypothetical protein C7S14_3314 [Burkholderia cepacia]|nr:hypothetical protein C7S14_3314 [Burkholderia cepacia]
MLTPWVTRKDQFANRSPIGTPREIETRYGLLRCLNFQHPGQLAIG